MRFAEALVVKIRLASPRELIHKQRLLSARDSAAHSSVADPVLLPYYPGGGKNGASQVQGLARQRCCVGCGESWFDKPGVYH